MSLETNNKVKSIPSTATKSSDGKVKSQVIKIDEPSIDANKDKSGAHVSQQVPQQRVVDKIDSLDWDDLVIEVRNLQFTYKSEAKIEDYLLRDINISFPKSAIYGLLGPSGCGKTSLLKLILGRMKPVSGSVKLMGKKPGDRSVNIPGIGVGFMPQELALYGEFSITEALEYFAQIYGMSKDQKKKRIKWLIEFLELPDPQRKVGVLSGGQQRRVSFAVALVHNPPLLVLDEPTVGVDPVLRERIWEHLVFLSTEMKISILITTHYIEEARRAHLISLMRGGKLLIEHSPEFLLRHFKADNLEDVFLRVCRFDSKDAVRDNEMPKNYVDSRSVQKKTMPPVDNNKKVVTRVEENLKLSPNPLNRFLALTHKNCVRLIRNRLLLAIQLLMPTVSVALFCFCVGSEPFDLKMAFYNPDNTSTSIKLSDLFLDEIDKQTISLKSYGSNQSAIKSVKDSKTWGALTFDKEFTDAFIRRYSISRSALFATNEDIDKSTILYYGDLTDLIITQTIFKVFMETQMKFASKMIGKMKEMAPNQSEVINTRAIEPPIRFVDPPVYGSLNPSFRDFMSPGIIICVTYILAVALTSLSFVVERKEGLLERTIVAGVKIFEILISQIVVQLIVLLLQTFLLMLVIFPVFKIANNGSYVYVVILTLMQGVAGMSFGLLISSISSDEQSAIMLAVGSFFPYLVMSGIIWPLEGMSKAMQTFSYFLPQTLAIVSVRNVMLRGWAITYTFVWLGFVSTTIWTTIFLVFATIFSSI